MSVTRKVIRKEILRILKGRTKAKDNVRANRSEQNWAENLPSISVNYRNEELKEISQAPRLMQRILFLEIELADSGKDGEELNDKLDDLCEEVESALSIDDSLRQKTSDIILESVDFETDSSGAKALGKATLTYQVIFHDYFPRDQKGQGVGELSGFDTDWRIGHHNDEPNMDIDDSAKDQIDVPV